VMRKGEWRKAHWLRHFAQSQPLRLLQRCNKHVPRPLPARKS